ncbi:hypothetical protein BT63DRAFT_25665 [Microthyrium microscopicum]|uniref:Uncharacterized protein n=1 Tax=Microthyrium microscopicum TaxID=703497 RepID=A0A6A6URN9_9PEZI|nr:hypothetical protein BT63DRAFT_25665 [Microthyrium microscopicum]
MESYGANNLDARQFKYRKNDIRLLAIRYSIYGKYDIRLIASTILDLRQVRYLTYGKCFPVLYWHPLQDVYRSLNSSTSNMLTTGALLRRDLVILFYYPPIYPAQNQEANASAAQSIPCSHQNASHSKTLAQNFLHRTILTILIHVKKLGSKKSKQKQIFLIDSGQLLIEEWMIRKTGTNQAICWLMI